VHLISNILYIFVISNNSVFMVTMVILKNLQLKNNNSYNKNINHKLSKIMNRFIWIFSIIV
jgi:hypothetical protein